MPSTIIGFVGQSSNAPEWLTSVLALIGYGQPLHMAIYAFGIIFFCFFYTSIVFNPEETADNLRKYGGFLPGIRPGKRTADYLDYVLTRLTVIGAGYITIVCLIPGTADLLLQGAVLSRRYIAADRVSVTMDTVSQIQSHLLAHQYEGLIKRTRLRGSGKSK